MAASAAAAVGRSAHNDKALASAVAKSLGSLGGGGGRAGMVGSKSAPVLPSQRTPQPKQYTRYDGHGRLIKTITPPRRASVHRQLPPLRR